ncbi:DNA cytosine methyltransferase [Hymenobacter fodinae]|uniref:Cytosine-specific methyltransferase n=1 Tax=Hymenobacter fodinae TaxID=2510796 RepID=A0A4Z0P7W3_9BACT|nr:DNA cytosine methyltransferase [Hymenobacter fodinae]TGE08269.1 DNA cytosine methyltransferase [Hymenobacter fodinae]
MYKVISTFSGIGGSSQGYKQAGLQVLASVEFLDYQAATYRLNHPTTRVFEKNIRELDPLKILREVGLRPGELDILDGSPPCSSFSTNGLVAKGWGKVKQYGNQVQRTDDLFFEYIRFLQVMQPRVFVAENVSGLIKGASKGHFNTFLDYFEKAGYRVSAKLMNAANYGVPQARERVMFVGVRKDLQREPVFPTLDGKPKIVTCEEALRGAPIDLSEDVTTSDGWRRLWSATRPGEGFEQGSQRLGGKASSFSRKRLHPKRPSNTVTAASGGDLGHWSEPRTLYIAELKRLQSFPDSYITIGDKARQSEGIGRAVPPLMMEAIARTIAEKILSKL